MHHALVIFLENNETRTGGTFLPLITESGVDGVDNGFIEIGVGIDNDRVLPAHLANDALELALARARFAGRLPNSQTNFARAGKGNHFYIGMVDEMGADDRSAAVQTIQNPRW